MREFLQIVIPAALTALVAGRVAITRTGRLRRTIRANVELLGTLPADHPSREALAAHIEELVDTLVLREQRQFEPMTWIVAWIGLWTLNAMVGLVGTTLMVMDPLTGPARAAGLGFYAAMVLISVVTAIAGVARWRRERDLDDDQEPDLDDDQATAPGLDPRVLQEKP
jgi:hypothetical protein